MYCPGCGQQQISDQMRFCSRCGLPMSGLAEWLASGGAPAVHAAAETKVKSLSPRQKGIRRGAKLLFVSVVLFPIFLVISLIFDEGVPMIVPFLTFFASLVIMLYARLFIEATSPLPNQYEQTPRVGGIPQPNALPPASNIPVYDRPPVRTNELAHPPSVTEHTTKLLEKE